MLLLQKTVNKLISNLGKISYNIDNHKNELPASANNFQKQKMHKRFSARAGIEPIIGHLNQDYRMSRNYLLDEQGDLINTLLAAAGFNLRKMLLRLKAGALEFLSG